MAREMQYPRAKTSSAARLGPKSTSAHTIREGIWVVLPV
jgi:hypothetical protein